ncbi:MAG TPA: hypothetical protein VMT70_03305 [Vicinamibacteria bacterium]|nr:hypothetical protein [Vicinamibacteria bacterium]
MSRTFAGPPERLNGWKEIAAHLGKGARTVQRWEKLYGLPVHRIGREGGEIVFAFRDEIDRWTAGASRERTPGGDVAPAPNRDRRSRWPAALGLVALAAGALGFASILLRRTTPATPASRERSPRDPAGWRLENGRLAVLDDAGGPVFTHDFGFGLAESSSSTRAGPWPPPVLITDVDGDGRPEVLAIPPAATRENRRLYCFEADGRPRFVHQPKGRVRYGDREYAEPWLAHRVLVTERRGGGKSLWAVFTHNLWFPSRLQELDRRGNVKAEFWSDGFVEAVAEGVWRGRPVVLAGGVNNELKGASLAIFDRDAFGGTAPASKLDYACTSCAGGPPREFLVFPTLCIFARKGGIAGLFDAWVEGDERLMVQVTQAVESVDGVAPPGRAVVHYTLDSRLRPVHAEISAEFQTVHALLERQGLLDHHLGTRDDAAMFPVLRWDGRRFVALPRVEVAH